MNSLRSLLPPRIAALLLALATLAPWTLQARADSWPQYGYDSGLSCFNPDETTLSAANVAQLRPLWTLRLAPFHVGLATQADDVLYVCSNSFGLSALHVATGQSLWSTTDLGRGNCGSPTLTSSSVLVTTHSWDTGVNNLSAFDRQTGALRWRTSVADDRAYGFKNATLSGNTVFVAMGARRCSLSTRTRGASAGVRIPAYSTIR